MTIGNILFMPEWIFVILLLTSGCVLLLIELFIIPGFGFIGIMGLVCMGWAVWIAYHLGSLWGIVSMAGSLALITALFIIVPKTPFWKKLRLETKETPDTGFSSYAHDLNSLLNKEGESLTHLRPAGTALIDGRRIDVVTEGIYIGPNTKIKVVMVKGNKVIVR